MEDAIQQVLTVLVNKFPIAMSIYVILSGIYTAFCAIAALTTTDKDDKIAAKLKVFFSIKR